MIRSITSIVHDCHCRVSFTKCWTHKCKIFLGHVPTLFFQRKTIFNLTDDSLCPQQNSPSGVRRKSPFASLRKTIRTAIRKAKKHSCQNGRRSDKASARISLLVCSRMLPVVIPRASLVIGISYSASKLEMCKAVPSPSTVGLVAIMISLNLPSATRWQSGSIVN